MRARTSTLHFLCIVAKSPLLTYTTAPIYVNGSTISDADKADIYVKIAETYLADDEAVDAEAFVNRASSVMEAGCVDRVFPIAAPPYIVLNPTTDHTMQAVTDYWVQLRYRVTYAKVLDANRKFLEAALRYYELSQAQRREIPQVRRSVHDDGAAASGMHSLLMGRLT